MEENYYSAYLKAAKINNREQFINNFREFVSTVDNTEEFFILGNYNEESNEIMGEYYKKIRIWVKRFNKIKGITKNSYSSLKIIPFKFDLNRKLLIFYTGVLNSNLLEKKLITIRNLKISPIKIDLNAFYHKLIKKQLFIRPKSIFIRNYIVGKFTRGDFKAEIINKKTFTNILLENKEKIQYYELEVEFLNMKNAVTVLIYNNGLIRFRYKNDDNNKFLEIYLEIIIELGSKNGKNWKT